METQIERELESKVRQELSKQISQKRKGFEKFKDSLIYSIGVPAIVTGLSYYMPNVEHAEACRQVSSWAYILLSPFVLVNGMRYARHSATYDVLMKLLDEAQNSRKSGLESRTEEKK